jgi:hypothetical protein
MSPSKILKKIIICTTEEMKKHYISKLLPRARCGEIGYDGEMLIAIDMNNKSTLLAITKGDYVGQAFEGTYIIRYNVRFVYGDCKDEAMRIIDGVMELECHNDFMPIIIRLAEKATLFNRYIDIDTLKIELNRSILNMLSKPKHKISINIKKEHRIRLVPLDNNRILVSDGYTPTSPFYGRQEEFKLVSPRMSNKNFILSGFHFSTNTPKI